MAGLCDSTVLTGQDGMIQFKPPGTSVCVRDFSAFGTDGDDTHITTPCTHDFRVNDIVIFREEQGGNLDSALQSSTRTRAATGEILKIGTFVAGSGYPASLSAQACTFTGGNGSGATGTITTDAGGQVTAVTLTDGGSGYLSIDQLSVAIDANITSGAGFLVEVDTVSTATGTASAYYVVARTEEWIAVSSSQNGTAISMNGDGGTGSADNELPAHINIELADWYTVCNVRSFSVEVSRDELDITTLPCEVAAGCDKLASFRSTQSGYAEATGTIEVYFTCDQETISNRLLSSSLLKSQSGARVKLFVCAKTDSNGVIDDNASLYFDAEINISGMSFEVNPDDPNTAELSFAVTKMYGAFGMTA
jgi:hypothetical protein